MVVSVLCEFFQLSIGPMSMLYDDPDGPRLIVVDSSSDARLLTEHVLLLRHGIGLGIREHALHLFYIERDTKRRLESEEHEPKFDPNRNLESTHVRLIHMKVSLAPISVY